MFVNSTGTKSANLKDKFMFHIFAYKVCLTLENKENN